MSYEKASLTIIVLQTIKKTTIRTFCVATFSAAYKLVLDPWPLPCLLQVQSASLSSRFAAATKQCDASCRNHDICLLLTNLWLGSTESDLEKDNSCYCIADSSLPVAAWRQSATARFWSPAAISPRTCFSCHLPWLHLTARIKHCILKRTVSCASFIQPPTCSAPGTM